MRLPALAIALGLCVASPVLAAGGETATAPVSGAPGPQGAPASGPPAGTAQATSAGTVLTEAEKGVGAASSAGRAISNDSAAINFPTVDSAFARSDGIAVPDAADQAPGMERLTHPYEQSGLFTGQGDVRVKRLLGSGAFTTAGDRLGTIRDVLLTPGGEPQVILEADGRKVEVPWSKMVVALPGQELHGRVVLPGATQHVLEQLPEFRPQDQHGSG
jgi:PRC-barrel domain